LFSGRKTHDFASILALAFINFKRDFMQDSFQWALVDIETTGTQFTVVHQWRHVCSVGSERLLAQWRSMPDAASESGHTYDDYKVVLSYLKHQRDNAQIIELD
jgi:hypothetical protein